MKLSYAFYVFLFTVVLISCKKDNPTPIPVADFEFTGEEEVTPCEITFTNTSENATSYVWNFGDGNISTEESPIHTYEFSDDYSVQLIATGDGGVDTIAKEIAIQASNTELLAGRISKKWGTIKFIIDEETFIDTSQIFEFFRDGSLIYTPNEDPDYYTWNFSSNETYIAISDSYDTLEYKIEILTKTDLLLTISIEEYFFEFYFTAIN